MKRIELARVAVNKAADQFVKAEDVRATSTPGVRYSSFDDDEDERVTAKPEGLPHPSPNKPLETGHDRLRRAEERLDLVLDDAFDRFCRGEITAREMNVERNRFIRAFNGLVRAENIRYRSMLRREYPT
jgi:hypothetical protein